MDVLTREELTERFYAMKAHLTNLLFASRRLLTEASASQEDGRTVDWTIGNRAYERIREAVRDYDDAYANKDKPKVIADATPGLRDHFAAAALTGMLSGRQPGGHYSPESFAAYAYRCADAMMEARRAKGGDDA
jgi:hypothetical protein